MTIPKSIVVRKVVSHNILLASICVSGLCFAFLLYAFLTGWAGAEEQMHTALHQGSRYYHAVYDREDHLSIP